MSELTREKTIDWLIERMENCERLAKTKAMPDRSGWLNDADYFRSAILELRSLAAPSARMPLSSTVLALLERIRDNRYGVSLTKTQAEIDASPPPTYGGKESSRWLTDEEYFSLMQLGCDDANAADLAAAPVAQAAVAPVGVFMGNRLTPKGTNEFWGYLYKGVKDSLKEGTDLYAAPVSASTEVTPKVVQEIAAERKRQIEKEGWSIEHDDAHTDGSLARAAACYAAQASAMQRVKGDVSLATYRSLEPMRAQFGWPWAPRWWKPKDPRRDLIRAAALIVAEIERLDRQ